MVNGVPPMTYPGWYMWLKWIIPIILGVLTSIGVALCLAGVIAIPATLEIFHALPLLISQLDLVYSATLFLATTGLSGFIVGICSAFSFRSMLLEVSESVAERRLYRIDALERQSQIDQEAHQNRLREFEQALLIEGQKHSETLSYYHQLQGRYNAVKGVEMRVEENPGAHELVIVPENDAEQTGNKKQARRSPRLRVGG